jgi:hypothetical protein
VRACDGEEWKQRQHTHCYEIKCGRIIRIERLISEQYRRRGKEGREGAALVVSTLSKSTRRSLPIPDRASICAAWLPTPPSPTTTTKDACRPLCPDSPRKSVFRLSCSATNPGSSLPVARAARLWGKRVCNGQSININVSRCAKVATPVHPTLSLEIPVLQVTHGQGERGEEWGEM